MVYRNPRPDPERGASLVEFAILMPLLVLLLFGIFTTARAWNVHNVMDHAAREGARFGATNVDPVAVANVAQGELAASRVQTPPAVICASRVNGGASSSGAGCILDDAEDPTTDDRMQVTVRYDNYPLNFIAFNINVNLVAQAVSRVEPGA